MNPRALSIPGLKGSSVIWDTKGHPGNPGIISIPRLRGSTVILDTRRHPGILGYLVFRDSRDPLLYGTPRDILGYLVSRD